MREARTVEKLENIHRQNRIKAVINSVAALIISLILGAILLAVSGHSPLETYIAIFGVSLGTLRGFALALSQATPIMFTGMSFAIAYKVRMINTGAEGQLYAGAMAAALVGAYVRGLPSVLLIALCFLAAIVSGGLVAGFVAWLKVKFGASEIILTLMLNTIVILFCHYLANGPLRPEGSGLAQTEMIADGARLTRLIPQTQLTTAIIIAILVAVILQFILDRTAFGYEVQVAGYNLKAAQTAGINVSSLYLKTFSLAGAVAGLGGAAMVLGVNFRFVEGFSPNFGFQGIATAALAAYSPLGVVLSAFLIGVLRAGTITINRTTNVPIEFVGVIQALIIIFVAAPALIRLILSLPKKLADMKKLDALPSAKKGD